MSVAKGVGETIGRANAEGAGALIAYLPAGFPDLPTSIDAAVAAVEHGVDIVELGLPYSDPVMDGPVIQDAAATALASGFRVPQIFDAVEQITSRTGAPVAVMSYWNPIFRYGVDRFADDLAAAGGAGLITPDLIPDEAGEWMQASERTGLDRIFLAAPSSNAQRLEGVVAASRGFVYAASTMGVTGTRSDVDAAARGVVERLRAAGAQRACVGLGISTPDQVSEVLEYADGAIVGSAFVRALRDGGVRGVARCALEMRAGFER